MLRYVLFFVFLSLPKEQTLDSKLDALVAQPGGLKANDVGLKAVQTSFDIKERQAEIQEAAAAVDQAILAYFPRLSLGGRYTRLSPITAPSVGNLVVPMTPVVGPLPAGTPLAAVPIQFPVLLNQTVLQASITVPLLDYLLRIPAMHGAASHNRKAAEFNAQSTRLETAINAQLTYYNWARARLQTFIAKQAQEQAQQHFTRVQHSFDVGLASKADVMQVEAQVASSELFVTNAQNLEAVLEEQMRTAMHDNDQQKYTIGEDLRIALKPVALPELPQLFQEAFEHRLELKALKEVKRANASQKTGNMGGYLPRLDAFANGYYSNPNNRYFPPREQFDATWDAGVQFSFVPNDVTNAHFLKEGAKARVEQNEAQEGTLRDALRMQVMQAYQALQQADLSIQSTERGLNAAEESYRVRGELFSVGRSTSVELTDAETDLTQARLNVMSARIDQRIARLQLNHALGRDIPKEGP